MKTSWLALVAASIMTVASAAGAAPCKGEGSAAAKPLLYYTADYATLDGLELTLLIGLEPATSPQADIAKLTDACVRTTFVSNSRTWTLHGDDADTFPRWATAPGVSMIVYLAAMPPPDQVHAWAEEQRKRPTHEPSASFKSYIWALVAADGDQRHIFGFYDRLPDDARLIQAMQAASDGQTPPILGFDVKTAKVDEGRMIEPLTLQVVASKGKLSPIDRTDADGVAFDGRSDGAVKTRLSDLICPTTADTLRRSAVFTTGAVDGSQEAGCRYVGETARLAVVATRAIAGESMNDAMMRMIAGPAASSVGQPASTPASPTEAMSGAGTGAAAFFSSHDGAYQAVWAFSRGDWFIEVYALYGSGGEAPVIAAVNSLLAANKGS